MATPVVDLTADLKLQNPTTAERQVREFERKVLKNLRVGGTQPLGRLTGNVSEFDKSLEAANARVVAFGASASIIAGVTLAIRSMVVESIKVEKTLADINVLLGQSSGSLAKFSDSLFDIAKNTGNSFDAVAEAAKEFSRQGLSVTETLKRTQDALILTRLSGLDAAKSVQTLTAAVNSFSKEGLNTTEIINRLANVDAKFAVSSEDLANAISRAGGSAQDAGVSFNELIALVTTVQQRTARGGAVIGNAFKSIFTRLQRSDTLDQLEQLGVAVRDVSGSTLPAVQILSQLAGTYDKLSDSQKSFASELVGGVYQINILKALFSDLGQSVPEFGRALDVANNSTNQAIQRNEELNKTLSALANSAAQNFTKLAAISGSLVFGPAIKNVFGQFNEFSDFIDGNEIGQQVGKTILTAIGNVLSGPGVVFGAILGAKLLSQFSTFVTGSIGKLSGIGEASQKVANIQSGINSLVASQPALQQQIINKTISQIELETQLLGLIQRQVAEQALLAGTTRLAAVNIASNSLVTANRQGGFRYKGSAAGSIPIANIHPAAIANEVAGAQKAGYSIAPKDVRAMKANINGKMTTVVYNNKEKVIHDFAGSGEPAIIPPNKTLGQMLMGAGGLLNFAKGVVLPKFVIRQEQIKAANSNSTATAGGLYRPASKTIEVLKDQPLSTFVHELGHFHDDVKGISGSKKFQTILAKQLDYRKDSVKHLYPPESYKVGSSYEEAFANAFAMNDATKKRLLIPEMQAILALSPKTAKNYKGVIQQFLRKREQVGGATNISAAGGFTAKSLIQPYGSKKRVGARLETDAGSFLNLLTDRKNKQYDIGYVKSLRKGDAFELFNVALSKARKKGYSVYSDELVPQRGREAAGSNVEQLYSIFPQLRYRKAGAADTTSGLAHYSTGDFTSKSKGFSDLSELERFVSKIPSFDPRKLSVGGVISRAGGAIPELYAGGGGIPLNALQNILGNAKTPENSGLANIFSKSTRGAVIRNIIGLKDPKISDKLLGGDLKRLLTHVSPQLLDDLIKSGAIRGVPAFSAKMLENYGASGFIPSGARITLPAPYFSNKSDFNITKKPITLKEKLRDKVMRAKNAALVHAPTAIQNAGLADDVFGAVRGMFGFAGGMMPDAYGAIGFNVPTASRQQLLGAADLVGLQVDKKTSTERLRKLLLNSPEYKYLLKTEFKKQGRPTLPNPRGFGEAIHRFRETSAQARLGVYSQPSPLPPVNEGARLKETLRRAELANPSPSRIALQLEEPSRNNAGRGQSSYPAASVPFARLASADEGTRSRAGQNSYARYTQEQTGKFGNGFFSRSRISARDAKFGGQVGALAFAPSLVAGGIAANTADPVKQRQINSIGSSISSFALGGSLLGSVIPGVGNVVGGVAGAGIGLGVGLLHARNQRKSGQDIYNALAPGAERRQKEISGIGSFASTSSSIEEAVKSGNTKVLDSLYKTLSTSLNDVTPEIAAALARASKPEDYQKILSDVQETGSKKTSGEKFSTDIATFREQFKKFGSSQIEFSSKKAQDALKSLAQNFVNAGYDFETLPSEVLAELKDNFGESEVNNVFKDLVSSVKDASDSTKKIVELQKVAAAGLLNFNKSIGQFKGQQILSGAVDKAKKSDRLDILKAGVADALKYSAPTLTESAMASSTFDSERNEIASATLEKMSSLAASISPVVSSIVDAAGLQNSDAGRKVLVDGLSGSPQQALSSISALRDALGGDGKNQESLNKLNEILGELVSIDEAGKTASTIAQRSYDWTVRNLSRDALSKAFGGDPFALKDKSFENITTGTRDTLAGIQQERGRFSRFRLRNGSESVVDNEAASLRAARASGGEVGEATEREALRQKRAVLLRSKAQKSLEEINLGLLPNPDIFGGKITPTLARARDEARNNIFKSGEEENRSFVLRNLREQLSPIQAQSNLPKDIQDLVTKASISGDSGDIDKAIKSVSGTSRGGGKFAPERKLIVQELQKAKDSLGVGRAAAAENAARTVKQESVPTLLAQANALHTKEIDKQSIGFSGFIDEARNIVEATTTSNNLLDGILQAISLGAKISDTDKAVVGLEAKLTSLTKNAEVLSARDMELTGAKSSLLSEAGISKVIQGATGKSKEDADYTAKNTAEYLKTLGYDSTKRILEGYVGADATNKIFTTPFAGPDKSLALKDLPHIDSEQKDIDAKLTANVGAQPIAFSAYQAALNSRATLGGGQTYKPVYGHDAKDLQPDKIISPEASQQGKLNQQNALAKTKNATELQETSYKRFAATRDNFTRMQIESNMTGTPDKYLSQKQVAVNSLDSEMRRYERYAQETNGVDAGEQTNLNKMFADFSVAVKELAAATKTDLSRRIQSDNPLGPINVGGEVTIKIEGQTFSAASLGALGELIKSQINARVAEVERMAKYALGDKPLPPAAPLGR